MCVYIYTSVVQVYAANWVNTCALPPATITWKEKTLPTCCDHPASSLQFPQRDLRIASHCLRASTVKLRVVGSVHLWPALQAPTLKFLEIAGTIFRNTVGLGTMIAIFS